MLNEILSVRNSTNSILFGIFYRVVTNYHHVSPNANQDVVELIRIRSSGL